jgi:hypothetical protein
MDATNATGNVAHKASNTDPLPTRDERVVSTDLQGLPQEGVEVTFGLEADTGYFG